MVRALALVLLVAAAEPRQQIGPWEAATIDGADLDASRRSLEERLARLKAEREGHKDKGKKKGAEKSPEPTVTETPRLRYTVIRQRLVGGILVLACKKGALELTVSWDSILADTRRAGIHTVEARIGETSTVGAWTLVGKSAATAPDSKALAAAMMASPSLVVTTKPMLEPAVTLTFSLEQFKEAVATLEGCEQ